MSVQGAGQNPIVVPYGGRQFSIPPEVAQKAREIGQAQGQEAGVKYLQYYIESQVGASGGAATKSSSDATGESIFAGTGLEGSDGIMKTRKQYKAERKELQAELYDDMQDLGYTEKMAKAHAKEEIKAQKAADKVLASVYFTPDQKDAYKAQKKALEAEGKRPILLTEDDMEMLNSEEFADAWDVGDNGKKTLNQDKLKYIAATRLGSDNTLEMEERMSESATINKAEMKDGKVKHKDGRKTKNFYKHLGFAYQKDSTEWKRAATIVGSTLGGAALGAGIGSLIKSTGADRVVDIPVPGSIDQGGGIGAGVIKKTVPGQAVSQTLGGAIGGGVTGAAVGTLAAMKIDDRKLDNDILNKRTVASFVDSHFDDEGNYALNDESFKGVKEERNQLMMRRIFQLAEEKDIPKEELKELMYRAEGATQNADGEWNEAHDALTERELVKLYNQVKSYEAPTVTTPPTETPTPTVTTPPTETPTPTVTTPPTETPPPTVTTPSRFRGRAVDEGIKARRKFTESDWKTGTNPMQKPDKGQYVLANENGEVTTTGDDYKKPKTITFTDNTNDKDAGNVNSYTYRLVSDEEVAAGKLEDGTPIKTGSRKGPFYVLVSADKKDGTDIKAAHVEVYEMTYEEDGEGENKVGHYDLRQYEGMSGYNVSSNDYSKRGTEGNNGPSIKWANWTKQSADRQKQIKDLGCTTAEELAAHLTPAPNLDDLIKANPSIFDANGNIKSNADFSKLDLPKGTNIEA